MLCSTFNARSSFTAWFMVNLLVSPARSPDHSAGLGGSAVT
jgi:hypothetical protein